MFAWLTAVISHFTVGTAKEPRRSSSYFDRDQRDEGESQRLLPGDVDVEAEELDHHDGCFPPHAPGQTSPYANLPVYTTIHRIRRDVIAAIDDPYSIEQLRDPRMNLLVVRPLVDKLYELNDISMVYCLLVNRVQFQREQASQAHHQSVRATRALLCELLANRILRRFLEDNPGAQGLLLLAQILVGGFDPFQNAPPEVMEHLDHLSWTVQSRTGYRRKLPALEIAIISESKLFLSSSACQKVVNAIYEGRVIYTPTSFIDILPDHYKHKPVSLYNPRRAPLFNQYRLIVPRTRKFIEVGEFILLLVLFLFVMADRDPSHFSSLELVFQVYTIGFLLDMFATILEHGWHVYTQNLWSFLDVTFAGIFAIYICLRFHGWRVDDPKYGQQAMDVLAMGAPVLVPRLAFNLMSENMLFVSLRAMMRDFTVLTVLAVWCFAGFLLSMSWLSDGGHKPITISKWMLWVWFGLDGTGIQKSTDFHWLLGPVLMVAFAFLGNTLFLTILVSMLSTTFSNIVSNATAEIQFRRSVLTLEGVKSDAIFAYAPPFNILALLILLPLKFVVTPRWFHKVNVAAVRTLNAPILFIIGIIVFDSGPPEEIEDEIAGDDDFGANTLEDQLVREFGPEAADGGRKKKRVGGKNRRDSVQPFAGLSQHVKDFD
ncbi:Calcium channel [Lachnellula subtilissima]|uniref:Calcium channel n=1 Tax=Lachnellula subtilissima TaxID=602034 RepID=A0A8H8S1N3_9HELO|nr:Calcium channel [Lachnellula subtilissima]